MLQKPRARPRRFTATQHIAVDHVAFSWRARFGVGPSALAVADGYSGGRGTLAVRMLGRTLQHEEGAKVSVGEAMRYLAGGRFVYWRGRVTSALALEGPFAPGS